jgi:hypothetical protein
MKSPYMLRDTMRSEIREYLYKILNYRKYIKRPISKKWNLKLEYGIIGKATGYSYKQTRNTVDWLVKIGDIQKFKTWSKDVTGKWIQKNWYRWIGQ